MLRKSSAGLKGTVYLIAMFADKLGIISAQIFTCVCQFLARNSASRCQITNSYTDYIPFSSPSMHTRCFLEMPNTFDEPDEEIQPWYYALFFGTTYPVTLPYSKRKGFLQIEIADKDVCHTSRSPNIF